MQETTPLSQMKDALKEAFEFHARQGQSLPVIVISRETFEPISLLIKKGN